MAYGSLRSIVSTTAWSDARRILIVPLALSTGALSTPMRSSVTTGTLVASFSGRVAPGFNPRLSDGPTGTTRLVTNPLDRPSSSRLDARAGPKKQVVPKTSAPIEASAAFGEGSDKSPGWNELLGPIIE